MTGRTPAALAALLLTAGLLTGCGADDPAAGHDVEEIQSAAEEFAADSYLDYGSDWVDPTSYVGKEVRLAATVGEVISPRAFTLADGDAEPLLVVHGGEADPKPEQGVLVTGTVRNALTAGQIEQVAPQAPALLDDWAAQPYIRADALAPDPDIGQS